jgi:hypothetical protein
MKRLIAAGLVALSLAACDPNAGPWVDKPDDGQECQEDMPCWDCETMGNRICGPTFARILDGGGIEVYDGHDRLITVIAPERVEHQ